ncbi:unnamed protein product [Gordionus sp. m RMFG-2023]
MSEKSAQLKSDLENIRTAAVSNKRATDDKFTNLNHKVDNIISKMMEFFSKMVDIKIENSHVTKPNLLKILTKLEPLMQQQWRR